MKNKNKTFEETNELICSTINFLIIPEIKKQVSENLEKYSKQFPIQLDYEILESIFDYSHCSLVRYNKYTSFQIGQEGYLQLFLDLKVNIFNKEHQILFFIPKESEKAPKVNTQSLEHINEAVFDIFKNYTKEIIHDDLFEKYMTIFSMKIFQSNIHKFLNHEFL